MSIKEKDIRGLLRRVGIIRDKKEYEPKVCVLCKGTDSLQKCGYCDQIFCSKHRLPENHLCPSLSKRSWDLRKKMLESKNRELRRTKGKTWK